MMCCGVNLIILALGVAAYMILGMLWYSNLMFCPLWSKLAGMTQEDQKHMPQTLVGTALGAAVMTYGLLLMLSCLSRAEFSAGKPHAISLLTWLFFIVPSHFYGVLWHKRHWKVFVIDAGYHLVYFIILSTLWTYFNTGTAVCMPT